jgi:hypothetical protein
MNMENATNHQTPEKRNPRMRMCKSKISLALLVILMLSLTGCVYFRLLAFKKQCANFDQFFQVIDKDGLTITAKKPLLYSTDLLYLGLAPTSKEIVQNEEIWKLIFEKIYPSKKTESDNFDITVSLRFKDKMLKAVHISENYFVVLPKPFVILMFKSLGSAKIDKKNKTATTQATSNSNMDFDIPHKADALQLLGKPYETEEDDDTETLTYKYILKAPKINNKVKPEIYWLKMKFDKKTKRLLIVTGNLSFGALTVDYSNFPDTDDEKDKSKKATQGNRVTHRGTLQ